ncbi:MAG: TIM barrel protein [Clostridia bacterium]|nr:TIM barrel protein [Clostridia bacterium]
MIKIGVADYGMNVWEGALYDYKYRLEVLKGIGYDGLERLEAKNQTEAIEFSADAKALGMDFATCRATCPMETLRFSAALGKKYVWTESSSNDFETFCRQTNHQARVAARFGVKVGLHNHLGLIVETHEQLDEFMKKCPECGLILDVGHLAAAGGDPLKAISDYADRIVMVHVKDFVYKDKDAKNWWDRLGFCELGAGEMGDLNKEILFAIKKVGYNGWICVEHDAHLREPIEDLKISREYIKSCGL